MGGQVTKEQQQKEIDACQKNMDAYIKCVEKKNQESGGLRDGDECEKEVENYRECRRKVKLLKQQMQRQQN